MKIPFIEKLGVPAKADPEKIRKEQLRKKSFNIKPFIVAFAAAVILLACVSIVTVIKETTKDNTAQSDASSGDVISISDVYDSSADEQQQYINKNILLILTKDKAKDLKLLAIMNIDSPGKQISLTYVPTGAGCFVNNVNGNMDAHFENGGIKELLWAVREYTHLNIDRYIKCDEKNFTDIMKAIGELELEIEDDVNSSYNGISYIIEKGKHSFTADAMLKYFLYLSSSVTSDNTKLTELISAIAQKILPENEGEVSVNDVFGKFVKYIDTDISAMDISKYSVALNQLVSSGVLDNFVSAN